MKNPADFEDVANQERVLARSRARRAAELENTQRTHDRRTEQTREHVEGIGRWLKPLGIVLTALVMIPTAVSAVMVQQYIPIVVIGAICALTWLLAGRLWRGFARFIASTRHGPRP